MMQVVMLYLDIQRYVSADTASHLPTWNNGLGFGLLLSEPDGCKNCNRRQPCHDRLHADPCTRASCRAVVLVL